MPRNMALGAARCLFCSAHSFSLHRWAAVDRRLDSEVRSCRRPDVATQCADGASSQASVSCSRSLAAMAGGRSQTLATQHGACPRRASSFELLLLFVRQTTPLGPALCPYSRPSKVSIDAMPSLPPHTTARARDAQQSHPFFASRLPTAARHNSTTRDTHFRCGRHLRFIGPIARLGALWSCRRHPPAGRATRSICQGTTAPAGGRQQIDTWDDGTRAATCPHHVRRRRALDSNRKGPMSCRRMLGPESLDGHWTAPSQAGPFACVKGRANLARANRLPFPRAPGPPPSPRHA